MSVFVWTASGNYPAGPFPWNSQPLAVSPAQTYFVPSPSGSPVLVPAENWNQILGQIATNLANLQPGTLLFFSSSGSFNFTLPTNCTAFFYDICGGGGAGGGGCGGPNNLGNTNYLPGGGGASAKRVSGIAQGLSPGSQWTVDVGAGGVAGSAGVHGATPTSGGGGGDGFKSRIYPLGAPTSRLVNAPGGAGGGAGLNSAAATTGGSNAYILGGSGPQGSVRGGSGNLIPVLFNTANPGLALRAGDGGPGVASCNPGIICASFNGMESDYLDITLGVAGTAGTASGGFQGGCGGGGGGASPFYNSIVQGNGGNGGNANNAGQGFSGGAGGIAIGGGGGGGGGSGGAGSTLGGDGGIGGTGGPGAAIIWFIPTGG